MLAETRVILTGEDQHSSGILDCCQYLIQKREHATHDSLFIGLHPVQCTAAIQHRSQMTLGKGLRMVCVCFVRNTD